MQLRPSVSIVFSAAWFLPIMCPSSSYPHHVLSFHHLIFHPPIIPITLIPLNTAFYTDCELPVFLTRYAQICYFSIRTGSFLCPDYSSSSSGFSPLRKALISSSVLVVVVSNSLMIPFTMRTKLYPQSSRYLIFPLLKYPRSRMNPAFLYPYPLCLLKHILDLFYVYNASGIGFVKQRDTVLRIVSNCHFGSLLSVSPLAHIHQRHYIPNPPITMQFDGSIMFSRLTTLRLIISSSGIGFKPNTIFVSFTL